MAARRTTKDSIGESTMIDSNSGASSGGSRVWVFGTPQQRWSLGGFPLLMGIVNVTPDSFSDGNRYFGTGAAVEHALRLVEDGADILDVGGESTRPGAVPVGVDEELRRIVPVIEGLAEKTSALISVDTTKSAVAKAALQAGAHIVNDISGLAFDPEMASVCRDTAAGVVCMHIQGTPQTMQKNPTYAGDVVEVIARYFQERLEYLASQGVEAESVVLDPGIGFGKTAAHNLRILGSVGRLRELGRPLLIGHSRKRFLAKVLDKAVDERTYGTVGVSVALAAQGVDIIRVHDVAATRDALLAWRAVTDEAGRLQGEAS